MSSLPDFNIPVSAQADCSWQPAQGAWCVRSQHPSAAAAQAAPCWAACLSLPKWSGYQQSSLAD